MCVSLAAADPALVAQARRAVLTLRRARTRLGRHANDPGAHEREQLGSMVLDLRRGRGRTQADRRRGPPIESLDAGTEPCGTARVAVVDCARREHQMRRQVAVVLGTVVAVSVMLAPSGASAGGRTSGRESFKGGIVTSGASGARTVVSTLFVARGAFKGVGRVIEVQNRPGDPDNVSRDDLVFRHGRIHIVTTNGTPSMSFDPQTCAFKGRVPQTVTVQGGTGRFRHATGRLVGAARARGVAAREADGSCSQQQAPLLEVDILAARGRMSI